MCFIPSLLANACCSAMASLRAAPATLAFMLLGGVSPTNVGAAICYANGDLLGPDAVGTQGHSFLRSTVKTWHANTATGASSASPLSSLHPSSRAGLD